MSNSKEFSQRIFKGKILELSIESARMPDGRIHEMEIVRHPGGAAVVAINNSDEVCLLREYRHAAQDWIWELPAGKRDGDENFLQTAQRELQEEAGLLANHWSVLGYTFSSPAFFTEVIHLYLARELKQVTASTEEYEYIEVHWTRFQAALQWATTGQITDAKTLVGLFLARERLET